MAHKVKPYDLFISYGHGDNENFVKRLYEDLTKNGYNVWYDFESMESNGISFLQNIRDALAKNPIRLILIVSPHAMQSAYVKAEWHFALENCQPIIPVLCMGLEKDSEGQLVESDKDYELLPEPLKKRRLHCIDFRKKRNYTKAFMELLNSLSQTPKNLATLHGVINKPNNYIERDHEIESIKQSVLKDYFHPTVVTSTGKATAIQGMGGIGKSVIAAAICFDCDIRRSFDDGIYWITIGQNPDLQKELQYIIKDDTISLRDKYEEARDKLRRFLINKNSLIVLDDVWMQEHIEIFSSDTSLRSRLLITTRNKQTAKHLSKNAFEIGLMNSEDALLLLANASNKKLEELPDEAVKIVKECGNLPLAISMIGGMIKTGDETSWKHSLTMLQEADLKVISQKFPDYPYPDLFKAIDISINSLNESERNKYLQLGIFKEDTRIPEDIIHILWETENWKEYHTHQLINSFAERSILQRIDSGVYGLHDLQFDYIQKTAIDLQIIHQQLLNKLGDPLRLSHLYAWNHYIWHSMQAGEMETVINLLQNFDWIEARLFATGINELLRDYEYFALDEVTNIIYRALKLSSHVLFEDKNQLPTQLIGRLGYFEISSIIQLLDKAKMWKKLPWIKPVKPSLTPPGYLSRILKGHTESVISVFVHEDIIISGSMDGSICVWDIGSGRRRQTLAVNEGPVHSLLLHGDAIISGSYKDREEDNDEGYIHVWNMATGECLHTLRGHRKIINSLWAHDNILISGSEDDTIRIWDIKSGRCISKLYAQRGEWRINSLMIRNNKIITESWDGTIRIWKMDSGQCLQKLEILPTRINSVFVHNNTVISGSDDGHIQVWDMESARCLQTLEAHRNKINSIIVHDNKIISASVNTVRIWDMESLRCLQTLEEHGDRINSIIVHDDKVVGTSDSAIHIWDMESGKCIHTLQAHSLRIGLISIYNNKIICISGEKPAIEVWDLTTGEHLYTLNRTATNFLIVHDNKIIGSNDQTIRIWETDSPIRLSIPQGHADSFRLLLRHGNKIISASYDNTICVWDIETGICTFKLKGHVDLIEKLLVHNNKLISKSRDRTIRLWDIETGKCLQVFAANGVQFKTLLIHHNRIINESSDNTICIWDIETGKCIHTLKGHANRINTLLIHNNKIISRSDDLIIRIWDFESGQCLQMLTDSIDLLLVYDNKLISGCRSWNRSSGRLDSSILIWDIKSGQLLRTLEGQFSSIDWRYQINPVLVYNNKLITSHQGTIYIWNSDFRYYIHELKGHSSSIKRLLIHDNKLISTSYDETIRAWEIQTGQCIYTLQGSPGRLNRLWIHDNKLIGVFSEMYSAGTILIWKIESGNCIQTLRANVKDRDIILFYEGKIIIGAEDGTIRVWEIRTGESFTLKRHTSTIRSLKIHDNKLYRIDSVGGIIIYDIKKFTQLAGCYFDERVNKLLFTHSKIIAGDASGQLHVLEMIGM